MRWAYGIMTVTRRLGAEFDRTLASLLAAGFDAPRLFIDSPTLVPEGYGKFNLEMTVHCPPVRTAGNWLLGLLELYVREPFADRYAIFQDDFVTYKNLRNYLEAIRYPEHGYWNLYTMPHNQSLAPTKTYTGWYPANQFGRGGVALVFSNEGTRLLLTQRHMIDARADAHRRHISIDGSVVDSFRKAGWTEYVHSPSLVQHIGNDTTMDWADLERPHPKQRQAPRFEGEAFDACQLLGKSQVTYLPLKPPTV